jgi:HlyD family secretion protein
LARDESRPRDRQAAVEAVLGIDASNRRRRVVRLVAGPVVAILLVATAAYWLLADPRSGPGWVTRPLQTGSLTMVVTATGSVQPTNKVDISTELSGTVRRVLVDHNSPVEAGEVLAELDTDRLEAAVASARARLAAARAQVAEAEATIEEVLGEYERRRTLAGRNVVSAQDLAVAKAAHDRAIAAHAHALAQVEVAQADLRLKETDLGKACICSPIRGIVLERNVDPGQTVAASLQAPVLFTIAQDLKQMELQVDIDEADVGRTRIGQRASFTVDAYPGRSFPAVIRDIRFAPETVQGVVSYKGLLDIDNADLLLRPGMTATAEIVVEEVVDARLVPNAALRFTPPTDTDDGPSLNLLQRIVPRPPSFRPPSATLADESDRTLWVLRDGTPTPVAVTVGASDGHVTQILAGDIAAGEDVIIDTVTSGG